VSECTFSMIFILTNVRFSDTNTAPFQTPG